jgi:hypothetical protein
MEAVVMNTQVLPSPIREWIRSSKVTATEREGGVVVLSPVKEGSGLRGIAASSSLTTEKMRAYKQEDKGLDR